MFCSFPFHCVTINTITQIFNAWFLGRFIFQNSILFTRQTINAIALANKIKLLSNHFLKAKFCLLAIHNWILNWCWISRKIKKEVLNNYVDISSRSHSSLSWFHSAPLSWSNWNLLTIRFFSNFTLNKWI